MGKRLIYWIPLTEWAKRLGIGERWAERLAKDGRIVCDDGPAIMKPGRDWLVVANATWKRKRLGAIPGRFRRSPKKHLVALPGPGELWAWEKPEAAETGDQGDDPSESNAE